MSRNGFCEVGTWRDPSRPVCACGCGRGPEPMGAKVGARRVGGPNFAFFFFPLHTKFVIFFPLFSSHYCSRRTLLARLLSFLLRPRGDGSRWTFLQVGCRFYVGRDRPATHGAVRSRVPMKCNDVIRVLHVQFQGWSWHRHPESTRRLLERPLSRRCRSWKKRCC